MKQNKQIYTWKEIKTLSLEENSQYYLFKLPLTEKQRTKAQNNTFWLITEAISDFTWYTKERVKLFILEAIYGVDKITILWITKDVPKIVSTSNLKVWEFTFLLEASLEFVKKLWIDCEIISREMRSLFDNEK